MSKDLTYEQKKVIEDKGEEFPYSGALLNEYRDGMYRCVRCEAELFQSDTKYDSKIPGLMGWPSFSDAIDGAVVYTNDDRHGMHRVAVSCKQCGAHLGHVFDADDSSTGQHYCINSVCLNFEPEDAKK